MRKFLAMLGVLATASILGMALFAGSAFAKGPKIKSVKFSGTPSEPTVTIKGKGLGSLPFEAAEPVAECFPEEEVATGNDFGTLAWFEDNSDGWRAGEGAGDCIGLIFSTYTETEVVYHFGSAYSHYPPLASGDGYTVTLNGLTKTGTVKLKVKKVKKH